MSRALDVDSGETARVPACVWLDQLVTARGLAARLCRRRGLLEADSEDFVSWMQLRLIDNDYATLKKFRGESHVSTFLAAVVSNLLRDYLDHRWGRWRPSAAARRLGELAIELETYVYRDALPVRVAVEQLRTRRSADIDLRKATEILDQLPVRFRRRDMELSHLDSVPSGDSAEDAVDSCRRSDLRSEVHAALRAALGKLNQEDQEVVRLRFSEGCSVADIARSMNLEQKPLYRRLDRILTALRESPAIMGLDPSIVRESLFS